MFEWYRRGTPQQKKTFWACYSGWALDSFDMQMFSFLLPALMATWALSKGQVGLIGTVALVVTAIGGWVAGIMSDRYGRVRVLIFTILWFTFFGVLAGFAQSYEQLLVARTLQGLGFGGEWAVGAALMAEASSPQYRSKAMGFVQSGFALGWALAVLVATILLTHLPKEMAWRVAFWSGVIPASVVLFIRRNVKESELFEQSRHTTAPRASLSSAFDPQYLRSTILASLLVIGLQAGCYAILVWLPSLLIERHVAPGSLITTILIMAFGSFCGFAVSAYLADKVGRRPTLIALSLGSWIVTVCYMFVALSPALASIMGFWVGFLSIGMFAALGPYLSELFPTNVRTTCMGFAYNVGKSVGASAVAGVGILSARTGLATAIGLFCLGSYAISVLAILMLPETRGVKLDELDTSLGGAGVARQAGAMAHGGD
ncbi:MFS transporter [Burkholderia anthina]|uniref:MFS transporter n=1 Tax=Burkholderia anthina TaxID=179879 RepID=UPI001AA0A7BC|nr:MFS transporter [Burkholderia anthina]QTD90043.1 MFS transporter [Burkholderia anthina]